MNATQKMLIASAAEHAELGRDYLRADMPGFALKHLRDAVERLEQAGKEDGRSKMEDGGNKTAALSRDAATTNQQGLIEI